MFWDRFLHSLLHGFIVAAVTTGIICAPKEGAAAGDGFERLTGTQIQQLFENLSDVRIPRDTGSKSRGIWRLAFSANGSWEGNNGSGSLSAWGRWRVENDQQCISIDGGDTDRNSPFQGCFTVQLDRKKQTITAAFPDLDIDHFVLLQNASSEIARLIGDPSTNRENKIAPIAGQKQSEPSSKPQAAQQGQETNEPSANLKLKHELEMQRLALQRQKLESETKLEQLKLQLEMERLRQQRSISSIRNEPASKKKLIPNIAFGSYHALVIGIDAYAKLPKLNTAVTDAKTVAQTLQDLYGFKVTLLTNPDRGDIVDAFDEYRDKLSEQDNLLVYYAGHGWLDQQTGAGYWLPADAQPDRRSRWVSNATLTEALQGILAKHVMVVADSCYSGTLTRSAKIPERNVAYLARMAEKRARVVLSSGGLEPVADSGGGKHSVFANQFLKVLLENQGVLDGTQLFEQVRQRVVLNADQTPEYSDIRRAGHEGGDFLFVRKR